MRTEVFADGRSARADPTKAIGRSLDDEAPVMRLRMRLIAAALGASALLAQAGCATVTKALADLRIPSASLGASPVADGDELRETHQ